MTGRRPIKVMPPDLAMKIAAGEVVERPASAVKELIDNAIDAGARHITVDVREAGLKQIRVTDDGEGMEAGDLPLAFTSHATSKITDLADLEHLVTLGFRGEALPSIAAVSRVEVQTRTSTAAGGTRFTVEFGEVRERGGCSSPGGTRITVADLFGNVPARRKFVRSLRAEGGQIQSVVMQYALAQPAVTFALSIDGRSTFRSPGTGRLSDAFAAVHGPDVLADMIPVDLEEGGIRVTGLCSKPGRTRANRAALLVCVNGRPVSNRSLLFALEEAYGGFIMQGRHPLAALHLRLPPAEVDANIHPAKSEVRLARDRDVHGVLYRAVGNALFTLRMAETGQDEGLEADALTPVEEAVQPVLLAPGAPDEPPPDTQPLPLGLPALRVFGQANSTFIIAEGPEGLYMIDQHAAHERVLYDLFEGQLQAGEVQSQSLLEPLAVPVTPDQMSALEEHGALLSRAGFVLEPFGIDACLVRAVPALAGRGGPATLVAEVLNELHIAPDAGAARERALAAMACKAAVKAGSPLEVREMRELVAQLERTLRPATCPHGRPTMIHLSHSRMEREFGRR